MFLAYIPYNRGQYGPLTVCICHISRQGPYMGPMGWVWPLYSIRVGYIVTAVVISRTVSKCREIHILKYSMGQYSPLTVYIAGETLPLNAYMSIPTYQTVIPIYVTVMCIFPDFKILYRTSYNLTIILVQSGTGIYFFPLTTKSQDVRSIYYIWWL